MGALRGSSRGRELALPSGTKRLCAFYTCNQPQSVYATGTLFSCPNVLYDHIALEKKEVGDH